MKKQLTEKTAYWIAFLLWNWLSKNPLKGKSEWPGWGTQKKLYGFITHDCPLCRYYRKDCERCNSRVHWIPTEKIRYTLYGRIAACCESYETSYTEWCIYQGTAYKKKCSSAAKTLARKFRKIHKSL